MKRNHAKGYYGSRCKLTKVTKKNRPTVWRLRFPHPDTGKQVERTFRDYEEARALYEMHEKGDIDAAVENYRNETDPPSVDEQFALSIWRKFAGGNSLLRYVLQRMTLLENFSDISLYAKGLIRNWREAASNDPTLFRPIEPEIEEVAECIASMSTGAGNMAIPTSPTLSEVMEKYREDRRLKLERGHCQQAHHNNLMHMLDEWEKGWETYEIATITATEINDKLDSFRYHGKPIGNTSKRHYWGALNSFFIWAVKRDFLRKNPVELAVAPTKDHVSIGILTPDEFGKLLEAAREHDPAMLSRIVLQGFCGLRRSEAVQYRDKPDGKNDIFVSRDIAKGKKGKAKDRYIPTSPQIRAWLDVGAWESMSRADELRYGARMEKLAQKAGITMPKNALRHSFASYMAALKPLGDVSRWLGHGATQMTESHYRQGVPRKDAEAYFSLMPKV